MQYAATRLVPHKQHWCNAASSIYAMQQEDLAPCNKQYKYHAASSIDAMQLGALVQYSKEY
jgi:hypothetical protein